MADAAARVSRRRWGVGSAFLLAGAALAVPWVVLTSLCNPLLRAVCLPGLDAEIAGSAAGLGLVLIVMGPLLVYTRWQSARSLGICPSCGADLRPGTKFCSECGHRLW